MASRLFRTKDPHRTVARVTTLEQRQSEPWIEVLGGVGFQNGWGNFGGGWDTAGYYKDINGTVWIKGLVTAGVVGAAIFTLPAGYRPSAGIHLATVASAGANQYGALQIAATGVVQIAAGFGNAWCSVHSFFRAA